MFPFIFHFVCFYTLRFTLFCLVIEKAFSVGNFLVFARIVAMPITMDNVYWIYFSLSNAEESFENIIFQFHSDYFSTQWNSYAFNSFNRWQTTVSQLKRFQPLFIWSLRKWSVGLPKKKEWNPIVGRQNTLKFSISECSIWSLWLLFHKLSFTLWNFSLHIDCWVNIAADIAIH